MTLSIRAAQPQDLEAIVDTMRSNRHDPSLFQQHRPQLARRLSEFLVGEAGGDLLGSLQVHRHLGGSVEILAVSVDPRWQGQGVGTTLLRAAIEEASAITDGRVWLGTAKPDYFARLGFVPMSRWCLPLAVLLGKVPQVLRQPIRRWLPSVFGRHVFMCLPNNFGKGPRPALPGFGP